MVPASTAPLCVSQFPTLSPHARVLVLSSLLTLPLPAACAPPAPRSLQHGECENLQRVVRELAESRAKAATQLAAVREKYGELQSEYHRMLRIADLSRTVRWGLPGGAGGPGAGGGGQG